MLALKKKKVWRERTRLTSPEFGLRRPQRFESARVSNSPKTKYRALLVGCWWSTKLTRKCGTIHFPEYYVSGNSLLALCWRRTKGIVCSFPGDMCLFSLPWTGSWRKTLSSFLLVIFHWNRVKNRRLSSCFRSFLDIKQYQGMDLSWPLAYFLTRTEGPSSYLVLFS